MGQLEMEYKVLGVWVPRSLLRRWPSWFCAPLALFCNNRPFHSQHCDVRELWPLWSMAWRSL